MYIIISDGLVYIKHRLAYSVPQFRHHFPVIVSHFMLVYQAVVAPIRNLKVSRSIHSQKQQHPRDLRIRCPFFPRLRISIRLFTTATLCTFRFSGLTTPHGDSLSHRRLKFKSRMAQKTGASRTGNTHAVQK